MIAGLVTLVVWTPLDLAYVYEVFPSMAVSLTVYVIAAWTRPAPSAVLSLFGPARAGHPIGPRLTGGGDLT